uniref:ZZ-type domain-containing protein n=1 Tax=Trypanosoma congolense (strain IL3000) TaxID=1068625 RepID=G0UIT5_TRYCI|nr:conserved hypothetical protein [Trypanosoma congolense IL3000]
MDDGECLGTSSIPWKMMLDYERTDAIVQLRRKLAHFSSDSLTLVEREEVICSSGVPPTCTDSLFIYGSVGVSRREAFLRVLRLTRLKLVKDIASQVVITPQVGDPLPSISLLPMWESGQSRSFRRWNIVYWAMRCGILRGIKKRYERMQMYLDQIVSIDDGGGNFFVREREEAASLQEEIFNKTYRELQECIKEDKDLPFDLYYNACNEEKISLPLVVSNVPTLIVVWASWDEKSVDWLRKRIFNMENVKAFQQSPRSDRTLGRIDPWLQVVGEFTHVPSASRSAHVEYNASNNNKRAQIVLVSIDREMTDATRCLKGLMGEIDGWESTIVPLLPLWAGPDCIKNDLTAVISIKELPYLMAVQRGGREAKMGRRRRPLICYATSDKQDEVTPAHSSTENFAAQLGLKTKDLVEWHNIEEKERMQVINGITQFLLSTDAPLRLCSRVDKVYKRPGVRGLSESIEIERNISSFVNMSGMISALDLPKLRDELRFLSNVAECYIDLKVVTPSQPVLTVLIPTTPTRYVHGTLRSITCSECHQDVFIDKECHFRCIHCDQEDGVLCKTCFTNTKHPPHHILLRLSVNVPTILHVLWGPSNVASLELFRGTLIENKMSTHIGVYCNLCNVLIRGFRWKCAMCFQFDLCNNCGEGVFSAEAAGCGLSQIPSGVLADTRQPGTGFSHPRDHMFLCIRHGCGSDGDACLRPMVDGNALKLLLDVSRRYVTG